MIPHLDLVMTVSDAPELDRLSPRLNEAPELIAPDTRNPSNSDEPDGSILRMPIRSIELNELTTLT